MTSSCFPIKINKFLVFLTNKIKIDSSCLVWILGSCLDDVCIDQFTHLYAGDQVNKKGGMTGGFYDYRRSKLKFISTIREHMKSVRTNEEDLFKIREELQNILLNFLLVFCLFGNMSSCVLCIFSFYLIVWHLVFVVVKNKAPSSRPGCSRLYSDLNLLTSHYEISIFALAFIGG